MATGLAAVLDQKETTETRNTEPELLDLQHLPTGIAVVAAAPAVARQSRKTIVELVQGRKAQ